MARALLITFEEQTPVLKQNEIKQKGDKMISKILMDSQKLKQKESHFEQIVSSAPVGRMKARIARRESRIRYRGTDKWARQQETQLHAAA